MSVTWSQKCLLISDKSDIWDQQISTKVHEYPISPINISYILYPIFLLNISDKSPYLSIGLNGDLWQDDDLIFWGSRCENLRALPEKSGVGHLRCFHLSHLSHWQISLNILRTEGLMMIDGFMYVKLCWFTAKLIYWGCFHNTYFSSNARGEMGTNIVAWI